MEIWTSFFVKVIYHLFKELKLLSLCLVTISVLLPLQIARFVMFSNQIFKNFGLFTTDGLAVHSPNSAGLHFFFLSLLAFGKLWTLPKFTQNLNSYKLLSSDSFFFCD